MTQSGYRISESSHQWSYADLHRWVLLCICSWSFQTPLQYSTFSAVSFFFFFPQPENLLLVIYIRSRQRGAGQGKWAWHSSECIAQWFVWCLLSALNYQNKLKYHYPSFGELTVSLDIMLYKMLFNFHVTFSPFLFEIIGT